MREIKFRAWNSKIKEMTKHLTLDITTGKLSEAHCSAKREDGFEYWDFRPMPHIVLLQYTGLKDKNGKEIYEGDIVQTDRVLSPIVIKDIRLDTLKIARRIAFERKNPTAYRFKVIGNIHENPELLK